MQNDINNFNFEIIVFNSNIIYILTTNYIFLSCKETFIKYVNNYYASR